LLREAIALLAVDPVSLGSKGLSIERIDGEPAMDSSIAQALLDAGFAKGFRGYTRRPLRAEALAHA
jgi:hypothetical protein